MAIFHIKSNNSLDVTGGSAFDKDGPDTLIVDANAFLISESAGDGARLTDSWIVTINGTLETFDPAFFGLEMVGAASAITIGHSGEVLGPNIAFYFYATDPSTNRLTNMGSISGGVFGMETVAFLPTTTTLIQNSGHIHGGSSGLHQVAGTLRLVNSGTIGGGDFSIDAASFLHPIAHIKNSGVFIGNVLLADAADSFTDFTKIGHVIKSGTVNGRIDLGGGDDHFNGGAKGEVVVDNSGADIYNLGGGADVYLAVGGGAVSGSDLINGGTGIDSYDASLATFSVLINLDTKPHGVLPAQFAQGADVGDVGNTDTVIGFEKAWGGSAADLLIGSNGANQLVGGEGTDDLIGLGGRDILFGGLDADRFIFQKLSDSGVKSSTRDLIGDFTQGDDHIRLVDLETSVGHAFTFIGTANFHHTAGELRQSDVGAHTVVSLDSNGDGKADFSIELDRQFVLTSGDFTL